MESQHFSVQTNLISAYGALSLVVRTAMAAQSSIVLLFLLIASLSQGDADIFSGLLEEDKRFPLDELNRVTKPDSENTDAGEMADGENIDAGEQEIQGEDNDDMEDDDDDDDSDDDDEGFSDDDDEEFSDDDGDDDDEDGDDDDDDDADDDDDDDDDEDDDDEE